jgi:hypothetical protein
MTHPGTNDDNDANDKCNALELTLLVRTAPCCTCVCG